MRFMFTLARAAVVAAVVAVSGPAMAERSAQLEALLDALKVAETVEVMQAEGARFGGDLARDMIPDVDAAAWARVIERIYDADKMYEVLASGFEAELEGADLTPILAYYQTPQMAEIVTLELSARRAFLDADTEAFAAEQFQNLSEQGATVVDLVNTLIKDSDLLEMNVTGALNSDLMFYNGLNEGGAFDLSEEEILADVWAGEEELRISSRDWLQSFFLMAYQPVDPEVLDGYVAFWRTEEGQLLNRAIFVAFDQMYEDISYLLGLAIAEQLQIQEL